MEMLREILDPQFLLRNSLYIGLLVGFGCPLVGVFLVLRRMIFLGVALPQISSTGVALALSMHIWFGHLDVFHGAEEHTLAFVGSVSFSLVAILALAYMERRGRGMSEGRIGTVYVVATAASILLLAKCPTAERGWLSLFKGEIITISDADLKLTFVTLALVIAALMTFRKEFLLVSFDRDMAVTLKKKVVLWDMWLYVLVGLTISMAVLSVGPLITFGFMLVPPLVAHLFARNMRQFAILASSIGGFTAFAGFYFSYRWDLPVGATDVVMLGGGYALAGTVKFLLSWWGRRGVTAEEASVGIK
jgi:ABC-type Mn2+/Zn2+ transport system permease subunit